MAHALHRAASSRKRPSDSCRAEAITFQVENVLVVAYLYNNNGMASWCWEAAHALHEAGQQVLLVCAPDVKLPGKPEVEIMRFGLERKKGIRRILARGFRDLERLRGKSSGFVFNLHSRLRAEGFSPSAYFLNQSNLQDPRIEVPQYVTGWAYPTSLMGYVSKLGRLTGGKLSIQNGQICLDTVGWWRRDWRAYRSATSVLAVSRRLADELQSRGVSARAVHPGTSGHVEKPVTRVSNPPKLLIAALGLEEPRKRVRWMIEALKTWGETNYQLSLVGNASDEFKRWVRDGGFEANFLGYVPRHELQTVMTEHDVFLFGSCQDDWGYVLVEAMGHGMIILAPDMSPFDEIVGEAGQTYRIDSPEDFTTKLGNLLRDDLLRRRQIAWARADRIFSRRAFGQSLLASLPESVTLEASNSRTHQAHQ
jgi:hypothetical protein